MEADRLWNAKTAWKRFSQAFGIIDLQYFSLETTGIQLNCKDTSDLILYSDSITILAKYCHPTAKGMSHNRRPSLEKKNTSLHFLDSLLWYSADLQPPTVSTAHNSGSDSLAQVQTGHLSPSHLHFQPMSLRMNIYLVHISPLIGMFPEICLWKKEF